MSETVLMPLAPLDPRVWAGRRRGSLPFPLEEEGCRLYSRARHGLVAGLRALDIGEGDEILVPAYHHGSEVEALEHAGIRCVFYDCAPDLAPDAAQLEWLAGERTRALHLTHHLGFPQDARRWRRWCDERGLALIEDAAQAWLARTGDRPAGAFGDIAIFSLYKTFGLPDGGALLCRAGAAPPAAPRERGVLRLGLEHAAWLAGRSPAVGRLATRLRPPGRGDATSDFAFGTARPPAAATLHALPRVAEPSAVERRRGHYELAAGTRGRRRARAVRPAGRRREPVRAAGLGPRTSRPCCRPCARGASGRSTCGRSRTRRSRSRASRARPSCAGRWSACPCTRSSGSATSSGSPRRLGGAGP